MFRQEYRRPCVSSAHTFRVQRVFLGCGAKDLGWYILPITETTTMSVTSKVLRILPSGRFRHEDKISHTPILPLLHRRTKFCHQTPPECCRKCLRETPTLIWRLPQLSLNILPGFPTRHPSEVRQVGKIIFLTRWSDKLAIFCWSIFKRQSSNSLFAPTKFVPLSL